MFDFLELCTLIFLRRAAAGNLKKPDTVDFGRVSHKPRTNRQSVTNLIHAP